MLEFLLHIDEQLFLFLNGLGSPYLDGVMIWLSDKYIWIPLYLYLIYRLYQQEGKYFFIPLMILILVIVFTDQVTSTLLKPNIGRLRPCKDPGLEGLVDIIHRCTGKYGFASGHAANSFGLAAFFYCYEKSKFSKVLLTWAALVAYSRVYLGVHYPGDIIAGTFIGCIGAWAIYRLTYSRAVSWAKAN